MRPLPKYNFKLSYGATVFLLVCAVTASAIAVITNTELSTLSVAMRLVVVFTSAAAFLAFGKPAFFTLLGKRVRGVSQPSQLEDTAFFVLALPGWLFSYEHLTREGVLTEFSWYIPALSSATLTYVVALTIYGFGIFLAVSIKTFRRTNQGPVPWLWAVRAFRLYVGFTACIIAVTLLGQAG